MSSSFYKNRPSSAIPSRHQSNRQSTSLNVSNIENEPSSSPPETCSKLFLTTTQIAFIPPSRPTSPNKASNSAERSSEVKRSPTIKPVKSPDEEIVEPALGKTLLKVKDEKGIPLVLPARKLKTNKFQCFLYRFKQEQELINQRIAKLKAFETELKENKIKAHSKIAMEQSILERSFKKRARNTNQSEDSGVQDISLVGYSPIKAFKQLFNQNSIAPVTSPMITSTKRKSESIDENVSKKPKSAQIITFNRPKSALRNLSPKTLKQRPQTADQLNKSKLEILKTCRYIDKVLDFDSLNSEPNNDSGRNLSSKAPLLKDKLNQNKNEFLKSSDSVREKLRPKSGSHTFMISNYLPFTPDCLRGKSISAIERASTAHSNNRQKSSPRRNIPKLNESIIQETDISVLQDWVDSLTIKGNTVTTFQNPNLEMLKRHPIVYKRTCHHSARTKEKEDKTNNEESKLILNNSTLKIRQRSRSDNKKGMTLTLDKEQLKKAVALTPQSKGNISRRGDGFDKNSDAEKSHRERDKRIERLILQDSGKIKLEGWSIIPTNENMEKGL